MIEMIKLTTQIKEIRALKHIGKIKLYETIKTGKQEPLKMNRDPTINEIKILE